MGRADLVVGVVVRVAVRVEQVAAPVAVEAAVELAAEAAMGHRDAGGDRTTHLYPLLSGVTLSVAIRIFSGRRANTLRLHLDVSSAPIRR